MKRLLLLLFTIHCSLFTFCNPVDDLLERIDKGASAKFKIEKVKSQTDFFDWISRGRKSSCEEIPG